MAAIDFPSAPILNQVFAANNGVSYIWNGSIWITVSSGAAQASDTPPSNPVVNQLWFNSALGQLFIYYNDGSSSQWVPANPTPSGVPVGGGIIREVTLAVPAATIDVFNLPTVKTVEISFALAVSAANPALRLGIANGSTVTTTNTYGIARHYAIAATPGADATVATYYGLSNAVGSTGTWGKIHFNADTTGQWGRIGTGQSYDPSAQILMNMGFNGATPGNGFQFSLSAGNFAAGSFVRVIGWQ